MCTRLKREETGNPEIPEEDEEEEKDE